MTCREMFEKENYIFDNINLGIQNKISGEEKI